LLPSPFLQLKVGDQVRNHFGVKPVHDIRLSDTEQVDIVRFRYNINWQRFTAENAFLTNNAANTKSHKNFCKPEFLEVMIVADISFPVD
jgi:hypothetical protein